MSAILAAARTAGCLNNFSVCDVLARRTAQQQSRWQTKQLPHISLTLAWPSRGERSCRQREQPFCTNDVNAFSPGRITLSQQSSIKINKHKRQEEERARDIPHQKLDIKLCEKEKAVAPIYLSPRAPRRGLASRWWIAALRRPRHNILHKQCSSRQVRCVFYATLRVYNWDETACVCAMCGRLAAVATLLWLTHINTRTRHSL